MDIQRLRTIIEATTITTPTNAREMVAVPHITRVDVHFLSIWVDMIEVAKHKDELLDILDNYSDDEYGTPALTEGPSYMAVGAALDDQEMALRLFGLGEALGVWMVITPEKMGMTGAEADMMAGSGFVMIDGYARPKEKNDNVAQ